jgi:dimethylhistidine N-methyltransferase
MKQIGPFSLYDYPITSESFRDQVLRGLTQPRKSIPSKFFYDEAGSRLFDDICELDEYYPTRTELAILREHAKEMVACMSSNVLLVELGSGSSTKTRLLLDHLTDAAAYVPVDIAREHLIAQAALLLDAYPKLEVIPVCADYTRRFEIPKPTHPADSLAFYFPGSTIGNLTHKEAVNLLVHLRALAHGPCGMLLGVDLKKDALVLEAAYDDKKGVTAAFNLNLLTRINRELGADFDTTKFRHRAPYQADRSRIEMHLVSTCEQTVRIGEDAIRFDEGEAILTEYSHKYGLDDMKRIADEGGFTVERVWTDEKRLFSVQLLWSKPA